MNPHFDFRNDDEPIAPATATEKVLGWCAAIVAFVFLILLMKVWL